VVPFGEVEVKIEPLDPVLRVGSEENPALTKWESVPDCKPTEVVHEVQEHVRAGEQENTFCSIVY